MISNFKDAMVLIKERLLHDSYLMRVANAMVVWLLMNIFFSFASYGLSSYEWYLFAGLSVVTKRLAEARSTSPVATSSAVPAIT